MTGGITQAEYWNGAVGERWARNQAVLDAVFAPLTEALFAAADLRPGDRVLDIGCGAGATTLEAARRVGAGGRVVGADISAPLLAVARARVAGEGAGLAPIELLAADVETADLGAGSYTRAISRFGVMFFADSARAFANVRGALTPDGRLTLLCWRALADNPWVNVPREAVLPLLSEVPAAPPPDTPGPFRFADGEALTVLLRAAGFHDVTCEAVARDVPLGRGATAAEAAAAAAQVAVHLGPTSHLVRDAEPPLRPRAEAAVARALEPHAAAGVVRLPAVCWLVQAS